jgi:hypothetical protein
MPLNTNFCSVKYSSMHMRVLKVIIWQKLYVHKVSGCSAHAGLALVKIDSTERALNFANCSQKADLSVSGS